MATNLNCIQQIYTDLCSLENQIKSASLSDQLIPSVLSELERVQSLTNENVHSFKNITAIWKRVYSYCIDVEINTLNKKMQLLREGFFKRPLKLLQQLTFLSCKSFLSETQKQRLLKLKDLFNGIKVHSKPKMIEDNENALNQSGLGALSCLPNETIENIFSFLKVEDLGQLAQGSSILKDFSHKLLDDQEKMHRHIKKGLYTTQTLNAHPDSIVTNLCARGNYLYSSSEDNTIKIWNATTKQCVATLQKNHSIRERLGISHSSVTGFCINDHFLYSGLDDGTIDIWDLVTKRHVATLQGHQRAITSLCIDDHFIYSGSNDGTIKIWDLTTRQCVATLQGHQRAITSLCIDDHFIYSGSNDGTIKIWDSATKQCEATFQGHKKPVHNLCVKGNFLYSSGTGGTIKKWDLSTKQCVATLRGHQNYINHLFIKGNLLYSGSSDSTIKIWDLTTNQCVATLPQQGLLFCFWIEGNSLYSGLGNGTITIWNFDANSSQALCQIAEMFTGSVEDSEFALEHFKMLPKKIKDAIYGELYMLCRPFEQDYWGCAEDAFLKQNGQSVSNQERIQAIMNYLSNENSSY